MNETYSIKHGVTYSELKRLQWLLCLQRDIYSVLAMQSSQPLFGHIFLCFDHMCYTYMTYAQMHIYTQQVYYQTKINYADTKCSLKIWGFRKMSHLLRFLTHSKKMTRKQNCRSVADVVFFDMFSFSDLALLCMFVLPFYVSVCACVCTCVIRSISQSSRRCCARCQRRTSS